MVGAYIVTKMVVLIGRPESEANAFAKVLAGITVAVTLLVIVDLGLRGFSADLQR